MKVRSLGPSFLVIFSSRPSNQEPTWHLTGLAPITDSIGVTVPLCEQQSWDCAGGSGRMPACCLLGQVPVLAAVLGSFEARVQISLNQSILGLVSWPPLYSACVIAAFPLIDFSPSFQMTPAWTEGSLSPG